MNTFELSWEGLQRDLLARAQGALERSTALEQSIAPIFTPAAAAALRAAASALLDDGQGQPDDARLDWLEDELQTMFAVYTGPTRLGAKCLPWLLELSPLIALRRPVRLSELPRHQRLACLQALSQSSLASLLGVFKTVITAVYLEHPDAAREYGLWDEQAMGPAYQSAASTAQEEVPHDH